MQGLQHALVGAFQKAYFRSAVPPFFISRVVGRREVRSRGRRQAPAMGSKEQQGAARSSTRIATRLMKKA
jgi:hypothetical protein